MSVAYSANTAYDYRQAGWQAEPEWQEPAEAAARPARRQAIALRRALVLVTAVAAAAVCIGLLYMKAQVFKAQREVNTIRAKIEQTERTNSTLSEQLCEAVNVNTIMERAAGLGMGYPGADQVLYVAVGSENKPVEMKN